MKQNRADNTIDLNDPQKWCIVQLVEKMLHDLFKEKRLRGEWFHLNEININVASLFLDYIKTQ